MYKDFEEPGSLKNPYLYSIVMQARRMDQADYWKNGKAVLALLKKILPLAKQEKEWRLYLETFEKLMLFETSFGKNILVIKYSQVFFQEYKAHFKEALAQYPKSSLPADMAWCFEYIGDVYRRFFQINDTQMESFWGHFYDAVQLCGYEVCYWVNRLEYALYFGDIEMATEAVREYKKQKVNYKIRCYGCDMIMIMGYDIWIDDLDSVEKTANQILSKNVPKGAFWMYHICHRIELKNLYNNILRFSIITSNQKAFIRFLPMFMDALHAENGTVTNRDKDTYESFYKAAADDFTEIKKDIEVAVTDAEDFHTISPWFAMTDMLIWAAYFKKLKQKGAKKVKISSKAEGFPIPDSDGFCSLEQLIPWYEKKADELGEQFEKSRKKFHFQALKSSFFVCCKLTA